MCFHVIGRSWFCGWCKVLCKFARIFIKKKDLNISPGPDGFHPRVIKELLRSCFSFHSHLPSIFGVGKTLNNWKMQNTTQIFSSCSKDEPGINRSMSSISVPGKIQEFVLLEDINNPFRIVLFGQMLRVVCLLHFLY